MALNSLKCNHLTLLFGNYWQFVVRIEMSETTTSSTACLPACLLSRRNLFTWRQRPITIIWLRSAIMMYFIRCQCKRPLRPLPVWQRHLFCTCFIRIESLNTFERIFTKLWHVVCIGQL